MRHAIIVLVRKPANLGDVARSTKRCRRGNMACAVRASWTQTLRLSEHLQSEEPHDLAKTLTYRASPLSVLHLHILEPGSNSDIHRPDRRAYRELKSHRVVSQPPRLPPQAQVPVGTLARVVLCDQGKKSRTTSRKPCKHQHCPTSRFPVHGWATILIRSAWRSGRKRDGVYF